MSTAGSGVRPSAHGGSPAPWYCFPSQGPWENRSGRAGLLSLTGCQRSGHARTSRRACGKWLQSQRTRSRLGRRAASELPGAGRPCHRARSLLEMPCPNARETRGEQTAQDNTVSSPRSQENTVQTFQSSVVPSRNQSCNRIQGDYPVSKSFFSRIYQE